LHNGQSQTINKGDLRLITPTQMTGPRRIATTEKGIRKLEKQIIRGRLTKASINNRGYNKFLKLNGQINVTLDQEKVLQDSRWDGLKGYLTNAKLNKDQIIENYQNLWQIEKALELLNRISKSGLSTIAFNAALKLTYASLLLPINSTRN
jgi:hypothetical protein